VIEDTRTTNPRSSANQKPRSPCCGAF
jgi:hypothetical protein